MNPRTRHLAIAFLLVALAAAPLTPAIVAVEDVAVMSYEEHPGDGESLAPGTYEMRAVSPLVIDFTVPEGWFKGNVPFAVWESSSNSNVGFHAPENLLAEPCNMNSGPLEPAVGPTTAEFVDALGTLDGLTVSEPVDVIVSDYPGKQVDVAADPADACDELGLWDFAGFRVPGPGPDASERLWIIDVDGTRLLIASRLRAGASPDVAEALQRVVDSVRIEIDTP
jgi:hypothetical protein